MNSLALRSEMKNLRENMVKKSDQDMSMASKPSVAITKESRRNTE